jgi:hypothetical protein
MPGGAPLLGDKSLENKKKKTQLSVIRKISKQLFFFFLHHQTTLPSILQRTRSSSPSRATTARFRQDIYISLTMFRRQLIMSPLRRPFFSPSRLMHTTRTLRNQATGSSSGSSATKEKPTIKQLIRKYGYSALGVYLAISSVDLPLSFLFVHSMGQEQILAWENSVRQYFGYEPKVITPPTTSTAESVADNNMFAAVSAWLGPTFWTEFGIAYALHKSLIFIRVPLTAAATPAVVKLLQKWGFNIGKKVAK